MPKFNPSHKNMGSVWRFDTAALRIEARAERDYHYRYDGDDEDGNIQAGLVSGSLVAFSTQVSVYLLDDLYTDDDAEPIASDYLDGSVYDSDSWHLFFTGHRSVDPMNRNCSIMRAARGDKHSIGHYFPDMVREAISTARSEIKRRRAALPILREA